MRLPSTVAVLLVLAVHPGAAGAQVAGPVEIPMSIREGRFVVPVTTADGTTLDFILSTGSAVTLLTESAAERLGADPHLFLGGHAVSMDGHATVADERLTFNGTRVDGMVAGNTLNQFDVLLDAPGGRLVLKPIGREVSWDGMTMSEPLRMMVYHGIALSFQVELAGRTYPATMDLGSSTVVVNPGVQTDLQIPDETTASLVLGGARHDDLPVQVRDLDILRRFSPDGAGFVLVGAPVAYDCALSISWVHQELRTCVR